MLDGGSARDWMQGDQGDDFMAGGTGRDRMFGGDSADAMYGGGDNDLLAGGGSSDRLFGGQGTDTLHGGAGADMFIFRTAAEIGNGVASDQITDFHSGIDRIDLRALAADFHFIGPAAFSAKEPELRFDATTHVLMGDLNGDGTAEFSLLLVGATLAESDLIF